MFRFPDKEVGQYPMAYVVRKSGSHSSEKEIMDFVAAQVSLPPLFSVQMDNYGLSAVEFGGLKS